MTDEKAHIFTFTTSEILKLHACARMGLAVFRDPELTVSLIKMGPPWRGKALVGLALIAEIEKITDVLLPTSVDAINDGLDAANKLLKPFDEILELEITRRRAAEDSNLKVIE